MNITVYLGANEGNDPALKQAVQELGRDTMYRHAMASDAG